MKTYRLDICRETMKPELSKALHRMLRINPERHPWVRIQPYDSSPQYVQFCNNAKNELLIDCPPMNVIERFCESIDEALNGADALLLYQGIEYDRQLQIVEYADKDNDGGIGMFIRGILGLS